MLIKCLNRFFLIIQKSLTYWGFVQHLVALNIWKVYHPGFHIQMQKEKHLNSNLIILKKIKPFIFRIQSRILDILDIFLFKKILFDI